MSVTSRAPHLEKLFPGLSSGAYEVTSDQDDGYNCIAYAAGETHRAWWPEKDAYWPPAVQMAVSLRAFIEAFMAIGYYQKSDSGWEEGFDKVALFTKDGTDESPPTHAARQIEGNLWTSKLGEDHDITHRLGDLEGGIYGKVAVVLRRPRRG